jgi:hypothetical protein
MRLIAAITDPLIARRILKSLGLSPSVPPLTLPASRNPTAGSWFTEPEVFDFDQTPAVEWEQGG